LWLCRENIYYQGDQAVIKQPLGPGHAPLLAREPLLESSKRHENLE
jgi:hypothetical protein